VQDGGHYDWYLKEKDALI